jgi:hypothetical protein
MNIRILPLAKKNRHTESYFSVVHQELATQSDRGVAIVAAVVLEELLELAILERFVELSSKRREALFDRIGAPLSTFAAKIEIAFAIGIIDDKIRTLINLIRDVRNRFAHRIEALTFDHPDISQKIETVAMLNQEDTIRKRFIMLFHVLGVTLSGISRDDIRIKPLSETRKHRTYLRKLFREVRKLIEERHCNSMAVG